MGEQVELVGEHVETHAALSPFRCVEQTVVLVGMPVRHVLARMGNGGQGPAQGPVAQDFGHLQMDGIVEIGHAGREEHTGLFRTGDDLIRLFQRHDQGGFAERGHARGDTA